MALLCDDIGNVTAKLPERSWGVMGIFNSATEDISQNNTLTLTVENHSDDFFSGRNATNFYENVTELWNLVQNESLSDSLNNRAPIVIVSLVAIISLATILGNVAIFLCIVKIRSMLTVYNIYIASLAVADCLVGAVVMPTMAVYTYYGYWTLGYEACTVWCLFDFTLGTVSELHLVAIAFDRYKSVTSPLLHWTTVTKARAVKTSLGIWFLGIVIWIPSILWFRITDDINGNTVENDCYFLPDKYFIVGQATVAYYFPVSFIVVSYLVLFCTLNKRLVKEKSSSVSQQTISTVQDSSRKEDKLYIELENDDKLSENTSMPASTNRRIREKTCQEIENQKISLQNARCIRTLGAIIFFFLICWLPFILFWPWAAFCESCISAPIYEASYWFAYGNSLLNPFIYIVLNRDFRRAFEKVFLRRSFNKNSHPEVVTLNSTQ